MSAASRVRGVRGGLGFSDSRPWQPFRVVTIAVDQPLSLSPFSLFLLYLLDFVYFDWLQVLDRPIIIYGVKRIIRFCFISYFSGVSDKAFVSGG
jgi:hypothetical protein